MAHTFRSLLPLIIVLAVLTSYQFISAQSWSSPTAAPPGNNSPTPINVSATTQAKSGNFMANIMAAATSTWSPRYCDELGNNCWDPATGAPGGGGSGITQLTGGAGITLSPTTITSTGTISINSTYTQRRVTGVCPAGQAIRQINADGTVICQASASTCMFNGVAYSQGAQCRTGTLSCVSGTAGYTYQTCGSGGAWTTGGTGCTNSPGSMISC